MTEWRVVPGYDRYEVSDDGQVRVIATGLIRKLFVSHAGYLRVGLSRPGTRQREFKMHRLVALAFIPNPDALPEVNHRDLDKQNNRVENLEWVTHRQNHEHSTRMGLYDAMRAPGRRRKMGPEEVTEMRMLLTTGQATVADCAKKYGVAQATITKIVTGYRWPGAGAPLKPSEQPLFRFTAAQRRIWTALKDQELTGADVCRVLNRPDDGAIYSTLDRLVKRGLAAREKRGRLVFYRALSPIRTSPPVAQGGSE